MKAVIDYETRSPVDLKSHGVFRYAECPDTEEMCLAATIDDKFPLIWIPEKFLKLINPDKITRGKIVSEEKIVKAILSADKIVAQNSMFEYVIWNKISSKRRGWPKLPLHKLHDTMAQLGYHGLPMNLGQAGKAMNLPIQKDDKGHKVMLKLCKPRKAKKAEREKLERSGCREQPDGSWRNPSGDRFWLWNEAPKDLEALFNYCCSDVETERLVHRSLAPLPPSEREIWLLDQKINLRGVPVDLESVDAIVALIAEREEHLRGQFAKLTNGEVSGPKSYVKLKEWINAQVPWANLTSVDKTATEELLKDPRLPRDSNLRKILEIKAEISKSSVSKFKAIQDRVSVDGRVRGWALYAGAATLRWSARGLQLHNQPRDSYKPQDFEHVSELFRRKDTLGMQTLYDDPFFVASRCVRGAIQTREGSVFLCADFASVESCGLAWLADDFPTLKAIENREDLYIKAIATVMLRPYETITKAERQAGKPIELGAQYGGGIGATETFSATYGVDINEFAKVILPTATDEELSGPFGAIALADAYLKRNPDSIFTRAAAVAADVMKRRWRANREPTVRFWYNVGQAAFEAVRDPGNVYPVGDKVKFCCHGGFLKCMLPSGRLLHYYKPEIRVTKTSFDVAKPTITYMGMKVADGQTTRQWIRLATYGSKIVENITQAVCRDLLAQAMIRLEQHGYPIVLHVHDECASERKDGEGSLEEMERIMSVVPSWAAGMPISAEGWVGRRYRK